MAKPWEKYQKQGGQTKPWERYAAPSTGADKDAALDAFASTFSKPMAGMMAASTPDELTRIFSAANEKWIAPAVGGLADLVADPVAAGINKLFGTNYDPDLTNALREGMRDIGASGGPDYQPTTELGQVASNAIGGVAAVLPVLATGGAAASKMAPGVAKGVMELLGSAPAQQIAGGVGAGIGSYVANEVAPGSVWADIAGMLGGAALGSGIAAKVDPNKIIAAFDRQGVPLSAGLVAGDSGGGAAVRALEGSGLGSTIGGSGFVQNTYNRAAKAAGDAVDNIAYGVGIPQSADDAGATLQASVARFMDDKADEAAKLFDDVGKVFGPDDAFIPKRTLQTLASSFDDIDDPALQVLTRDPRFQKYAAAFIDENGAAKALSYNTLKGFRSYLGRQMNKLTLDGGADNAQLKALYGALTDDMEAALRTKGGDAAVQSFRSVNDWYKAQMETARNSLQPLVGKGATPANAEKAFSVLTQSAGAKTGNIQRLKDIYKGLTPMERQDMTASILAKMGQGKDGFSPAKFLSDLANMSDEAKNVVFRQQFGDDMLQAWEDLTEVIMPQIERASSYINRSRSGMAGVQIGQAGVVAGTALANPATAIAALVGPGIMAKAMTTPAVVRFMAAAIRRGETAAAIAARVTAMLQAQQAPNR